MTCLYIFPKLLYETDELHINQQLVLMHMDVCQSVCKTAKHEKYSIVKSGLTNVWKEIKEEKQSLIEKTLYLVYLV